jgi:hypothetical protein
MRTKASTIFLLSALAVATGLLTASAKAESVNVPFEFIAHDHNFPSGDYAVEQNPGKHLVTLRSVKGNATLNWLVGAGTEWNGGHVQLSFGSSANGKHVLRSIQFSRRFVIEGNLFQPDQRNRVPLQP